MLLYHFQTSPYARRVRLVLALKGVSAELRDARADPKFMADVHRLNPTHTVPVLVDGDRTIVDSTAICHYLDRKFPEPPLWPAGVEGARAFEFMALCDTINNVLIDLGLRYASLHEHPEFPTVRGALVGRAQRALERVASMAAEGGDEHGHLCGGRWTGADIAVFTTVSWLEGLPARASTFALAKRMSSLGWSVPASLRSWAERHAGREDVRALG